MTSICLYFQVHQPYRIKRYSFFQVEKDHQYFDDPRNTEIIKRVAETCYCTANDVLLKNIKRFGSDFKVCFSISGLALEQLLLYAPQAIDSFKRLADTGCVEFLAETYYHSLAAIYDEEEFLFQIHKHSHFIRELFGQVPKVLRNTELIFNDRIAQLAAAEDYYAVLAEGSESALAGLSPNHLYKSHACSTRLLLRNYHLSDEIAFRFSRATHREGVLSAEYFVRLLLKEADSAETFGLFMDYETFGEHYEQSSGVLSFLEELPALVLASSKLHFLTPSAVCSSYRPQGELSQVSYSSWADQNKDLSAWASNKMQLSALNRVYKLLKRLKSCGPEQALEICRKLLSSDHFYYMSVKSQADGIIHSYFSPFESPYEAFISYMNVLRDLEYLTHLFSKEVPEAELKAIA